MAEGSLGKGAFLQVSGVSFTLRSGRARRAAGSTGDGASRGWAASSGPATRSGWRFPSIRRAKGGTVPGARGRVGLRHPGGGATGGGSPDAVRRGFARRARSTAPPAGRIVQGRKHKSRLSNARRDR